MPTTDPRKLKQQFIKLDKFGTGLDFSKMVDIFQKHGYTKEMAQEIVQKSSASLVGKVNFEEFALMMSIIESEGMERAPSIRSIGGSSSCRKSGKLPSINNSSKSLRKSSSQKRMISESSLRISTVQDEAVALPDIKDKRKSVVNDNSNNSTPTNHEATQRPSAFHFVKEHLFHLFAPHDTSKHTEGHQPSSNAAHHETSKVSDHPLTQQNSFKNSQLTQQTSFKNGQLQKQLSNQTIQKVPTEEKSHHYALIRESSLKKHQLKKQLTAEMNNKILKGMSQSKSPRIGHQSSTDNHKKYVVPPMIISAREAKHSEVTNFSSSFRHLPSVSSNSNLYASLGLTEQTYGTVVLIDDVLLNRLSMSNMLFPYFKDLDEFEELDIAYQHIKASIEAKRTPDCILINASVIRKQGTGMIKDLRFMNYLNTIVVYNAVLTGLTDDMSHQLYLAGTDDVVSTSIDTKYIVQYLLVELDKQCNHDDLSSTMSPKSVKSGRYNNNFM